MVDQGEIHFVLGMSIKRDRATKVLFINQEKYLEGVLNRFGMQDCKSVSTPLETNLVPRAMPVRGLGLALALGKLTTGTPKFRGSGFVGMHVKPITAQEKFNFQRANAILARAQALLWVRD